MASWVGRLGWLPAFVVGCAPGEEVARLELSKGKTERITVDVKAGQEIHFWEDFEYHPTGEKTLVKRLECHRWEITATIDGDEKTLKCWAHEGSRCDSVHNRSRFRNCEVPDCVLKARDSGEVAIEAKLREMEDCGMEGTSTLRVRRVGK